MSNKKVSENETVRKYLACPKYVQYSVRLK